METDILYKLREIIKTKIFKRIDHKILVYLVFVGIATVFWFLNELNNTFNTTISYPIKFTHLPNNKSLVNKLPEEIQLSINTDGYTILKYKLSPISFPVSVNVEKHSGNIDDVEIKQYKLQTRYIRKAINRQIPNYIEIVDIFPDTINFEFANLITKKILIKPDITLEFRQECMLNGDVTFTPDSIEIRGPNTILDTLQAVYTKHHVFLKLNKKIKQEITLKKINELEYKDKKVKINIPVSKFTQLNFDLTVEAINVPDSLNLKTFPRKVKVSCIVALSDYNKIKADDFIIEVDYLDIKHLLGGKLSLNLKHSPFQAKSISYYPEGVEFILDKKLW